jgi:hypothetical protein
VLSFIYQYILGRRVRRQKPHYDPSDLEMGLLSEETLRLRQQLEAITRTMEERVRCYEERLNTLQKTVRLLSEDVTLLRAAQGSSSEGSPSPKTQGRKIESLGSSAEGLPT